MRARLGLDQSLLDQYLHYLQGLVQGDLGQALINQEPVRTIIGRTLPASLELSVIALVLAAVIGLSIGFSGIARPEGKLDLAGRLYGLATSHPPFWVAMVQLLLAVSSVFAVGTLSEACCRRMERLTCSTASSASIGSPCGTIRHLVLPASTRLAERHLHNGLAINQANPARRLCGRHAAAGCEPRVLRHGLLNALLPVLTIAGITVASLIGGALLIEVTSTRNRPETAGSNQPARLPGGAGHRGGHGRPGCAGERGRRPSRGGLDPRVRY